MGSLPTSSRTLRLGFMLPAACLVSASAHPLVALAGHSLDSFVEDWLYTAIELGAVGLCLLRVVRVREERAAWLLMGISLITWSAGDLLWTVWLDGVSNPPYPSIADALYLVMYPAVYASLGLMM